MQSTDFTAGYALYNFACDKKNCFFLLLIQYYYYTFFVKKGKLCFQIYGCVLLIYIFRWLMIIGEVVIL